MEVINSVLHNQHILSRIEQSINSNSAILVKESLYILANILACSNFEILDDAILDMDVFSLLIPIMEKHSAHQQILPLILRMFDLVFDFEQRFSKKLYYLRFEKLGGVDLLEHLQQHPNIGIY